MRTQEPKHIDLPWGNNKGVKLLKNSSLDNQGLSLQSQMTKETPTVLALGIHKLSSLGEDGWTLTDGHTVLLCSSSAGDGTPELAVLVLESFTCYHFSSKELEESGWLKAIDRATHGACHSGLTILVSNEGGFSSLSSFSIDPSKELLRQTSSPALPDGINLSAISIDGQYICIARKGSDENYQWEILVLDRATYQNIATLSGPVVKAQDGGDNHVQDIFIRKTCIVAVTTRGHLFYWNEEFVAIPDQSPNRIDDLLSDERRIDTVCLSQDLERVVMMDLIAADDVAMILCKQPSRIPADSRRTSRSRYLRIDSDCQTVVRGSMTNDGNKIITPRFDIYPISEAEPWATIEPISASLEADLGPFIDVWVNKISLTYFGEKGAIQVRFDGNNKTTSLRDGNLTSSRYMPLSYDCWNAVNQSNDEHRDSVQVKSTATSLLTRTLKHHSDTSPQRSITAEKMSEVNYEYIDYKRYNVITWDATPNRLSIQVQVNKDLSTYTMCRLDSKTEIESAGRGLATPSSIRGIASILADSSTSISIKGTMLPWGDIQVTNLFFKSALKMK